MMCVTLVGTGCGAPENMTMEVRQALLDADLIIGAKRLLQGLPADCTASRQPAIYAAEICALIQSAQKGGIAAVSESLSDAAVRSTAVPGNDAISGTRDSSEAMLREGEEPCAGPRICVAFSGDSGFYSGTRTLLPLLREAGIEARVLPGISSVQVLAARLGQPWQDWTLVSAHGTDCDAVTAVMGNKPVFFLTGGKLGPAQLCSQLAEAGLGDLAVTVGERLSYEEERILTGTAAEFAACDFAPLSVMLAQPAAWAGDLTPGIPDSAFIRGEVPMTKRDVRAAVLSHLQVRPGDTVWDVGAGTGSVSVELAMRACVARVYAVERDPEGSLLIRQNRDKFGVWNLCPVDGAAPAALADLPAPNRVFIGGSGGHLEEVIRIAVERARKKCTSDTDSVGEAAGKMAKPGAHCDPGRAHLDESLRICVAAILLETMHEAVEVMTNLGMDVEITQVSFSTARALGKSEKKKHMMVGGNPIFLITGQLAAEVVTSDPAAASSENPGTADGTADGDTPAATDTPMGGRHA